MHLNINMILNDLNDFILPSQVCVNPLAASGGVGGAVRLDVGTPDLGHLAYEAEATPAPQIGVIKTKTKDDVKIASISLSDCLACR